MGRASLLLVLLVVSAGCATAPLYQCKSLEESRWTRIDSEHFELTTDMPVEDGRSYVTCLEKAWLALSMLAFRSATPPTDKALVVALSKRGPIAKELLLDRAAGFFQPDPWEEKPLLVFVGDLDLAACQIAQHELVHRFLFHFSSAAPRWLHEGMARFWETLSVDDDGRASIGDSTLCVGHEPGVAPRHCSPIWVLANAKMPKLAELTDLQPRVFYSGNVYASYLAARELVRLLYSPPYQQAFVAYTSKLNGATSPKKAWQELLDTVGADALERDYEALLTVSAQRIWWHAQSQRPPWIEPPMTVRPLEEHAAHRLQARFLPAGTAKQREVVEQHLSEMLQHEPGSADARVMRAQLWLRKGELAAATSELDELKRAGIKDHRASLLRVRGLIAAEEALPPALRDWTAAEAAAQELMRLAHTPASLNSLAWYFAQRNQPAVGAPFARRALEKDPGCWECLDTLGVLLFELGQVPEAIDAEVQAINLMPVETPPLDMLYRLETYERTLAAQTSTSAAR